VPLTVADPVVHSGALGQLGASLDASEESERWDSEWEVLFSESLRERQSLNSACDATVDSEIGLVDNEEPAPFAGGRVCKIYNLGASEQTHLISSVRSDPVCSPTRSSSTIEPNISPSVGARALTQHRELSESDYDEIIAQVVEAIISGCPEQGLLAPDRYTFVPPPKRNRCGLARLRFSVLVTHTARDVSIPTDRAVC
jgi:hypothetical protein